MTRKKTTSTNEDKGNDVIDQHTFNPESESKEETKGASRTERGQRQPRRKVYQRFKESEIPQDVKDIFAKDGYDLRFIRWSIAGEMDNRKLALRQREGYEFVKANELPEDYKATLRIRDTQMTNGLVTNGGDLCLMKIDSDLRQSRIEYYQGVAQAQQDAVDVNVLEKKGLRNLGTRSKVMMKEPSFQD